MDILVGGFGKLHHAACPGIEQLVLDAGGDNSGEAKMLRHERLLSDAPSPTWMEYDVTEHGDRVLYAVLEDTNEVASFRVTGEGASLRLEELSRVPTPGQITNHVAFVRDDEGHGHVITANYGDGHVCVHPVTDDGVVLEVTQVLRGKGHGPLLAQDCPRAHWVQPVPDGRVLTSDLGADRVYVHHWEHGELVREGEVVLEPGTGPRDQHLLPVASDDLAHDWRVAVVGEWGGTVTLIGPAPAGSSAASAAGPSADSSVDSAEVRVLQTVSLGPDKLPRPDQSASLAFVPWSVLHGETDEVSDPDKAGAPNAVAADVQPTGAANAGVSGLAYVGLRGSERIVTLAWDGECLSRLDAPDMPGWRGRGIDCAGKRPRHLLAIGNLLLAANEVSDSVAVFRLAADGEPKLVESLPSGAPTVFVRL